VGCNGPPEEAVYSTADWAQPRAPGVDLPAERQYRHPVALTALRPFVRLSRRLERQVVTPVAPEPAPAPRPVPAPSAAPAPAPATEHRPAPDPAPAAAPAPVPAATSAAPVPAPAPTTEVERDAASGEQFQSVDASVVPVPIESLNRLVLAVDELGSEMTHVRQAIRDLTAALSDSQASFARLLASQGGSPEGPDPLAAVTGPYVAGEPTPTPFPAEQAAATAPAAVPPAAAPFAPEAPTAPMPTANPVEAPFPAHANGLAHDHTGTLAPEQVNGLGDLPIVSTGAVQVVIGPISSLDELDDAVEHIRRINGVESVAVTSFEGPHVVLTTELSRALPLASLLRNELGREVVSCRLVDGRIVADFGEAGPRA
jgi:hypothetical protein